MSLLSDDLSQQRRTMLVAMDTMLVNARRAVTEACHNRSGPFTEHGLQELEDAVLREVRRGWKQATREPLIMAYEGGVPLEIETQFADRPRQWPWPGLIQINKAAGSSLRRLFWELQNRHRTHTAYVALFDVIDGTNRLLGFDPASGEPLPSVTTAITILQIQPDWQGAFTHVQNSLTGIVEHRFDDKAHEAGRVICCDHAVQHPTRLNEAASAWHWFGSGASDLFRLYDVGRACESGDAFRSQGELKWLQDPGAHAYASRDERKPSLAEFVTSLVVGRAAAEVRVRPHQIDDVAATIMMTSNGGITATLGDGRTLVLETPIHELLGDEPVMIIAAPTHRMGEVRDRLASRALPVSSDGEAA